MNNRQQRILGILKDQRFLTVGELASLIHFSKSTIRRDLDDLEKSNLIQRTHGGALYLKPNEIEMPTNVKENVRAKQKHYIAGLATNYIQENQTIFLDGSSTCTILAKDLSSFEHLTVITTNLVTATYLSLNTQNKVIIVGGTMSDVLASSAYSAAYIKNYVYDLAFFSCRGLNKKFGITDRLESEASIKQAMVSHAKNNILLIDSQKFGQTFTFEDCQMNELQTIITNKKPSEDYQKFISDNNVELVY